jgi:hypothetical protein
VFLVLFYGGETCDQHARIFDRLTIVKKNDDLRPSHRAILSLVVPEVPALQLLRPPVEASRRFL